MMQTMGRIATLKMAADAVNMPIDRFNSWIADEIKEKTGRVIELDV